MTRRQSYFARQKLIGLVAIIASVLASLWIESIVPVVIFAPYGCVALFTKEMVIMDSYYFEMEEEREFRREMKRRRTHR